MVHGGVAGGLALTSDSGDHVQRVGVPQNVQIIALPTHGIRPDQVDLDGAVLQLLHPTIVQTWPPRVPTP